MISIQRVSQDDSVRLLELSRQTFLDAFAHLNEPADMEAFAREAFTLASFEQQLNNPNSHFYFAVVDDEVAGYIKLNYNAAQTEFKDPNALEVERIYVLQQYQGQQVGRRLLEFAIQSAIDKNFDYIWLGVWEHNAGAIRFYQNNSFRVIGSHPFVLGNDKQTDLLMRREISPL